ncbi:hypothetical protein PR002_g30130, partial [Phytophthora rubi]
HVRDYTTGVKERFYEGARDFLSSHEHVKTKKQCKTKCGELESGYKQYKQKLAQSGFGLQVSDPPSIKEMLQKKCPFYYEIDEIFGQRHNTNPPVVMEPGRVLLEGHEDGINSNTNVAGGNEDDNSRVTGGHRQVRQGRGRKGARWANARLHLLALPLLLVRAICTTHCSESTKKS